jgi:hypothetical protein
VSTGEKFRHKGSKQVLNEEADPNTDVCLNRASTVFAYFAKTTRFRFRYRLREEDKH